MRTTVNLDDDVLLAAKELARLRGRTLGEVLSDLARQALTGARPAPGTRNGVPLLEPVPGEGIVTPGVVARLRDDG